VQTHLRGSLRICGTAAFPDSIDALVARYRATGTRASLLHVLQFRPFRQRTRVAGCSCSSRQVFARRLLILSCWQHGSALEPVAVVAIGQIHDEIAENRQDMERLIVACQTRQPTPDWRLRWRNMVDDGLWRTKPPGNTCQRR
jgi:hypothetical protein